jgi:hypothetical protein
MSYGRGLGKRGRPLSGMSSLEIDRMREAYDDREEARYQREQEEREPRQDPRVDDDDE